MSGMLKDKTAVVTGGEGGIGQAVCRRLAKEGAAVVSADLERRSPAPASVSSNMMSRVKTMRRHCAPPWRRPGSSWIFWSTRPGLC